MVKKSKKSKSKRLSLKKKYKIQRKVKEHHKKKAKEAKKLGLNKKRKVKKDPGIPNDWPFKEQELKALEAGRQRAIQELEEKKAARKQRENDMSPSIFHFLVSILASKSELIEDELLCRPLGESKNADSLTLPAHKQMLDLSPISNILTRWKSSDDMVKNASSTEDYHITEVDVDKLLDCCSRASRSFSG